MTIFRPDIETHKPATAAKITSIDGFSASAKPVTNISEFWAKVRAIVQVGQLSIFALLILGGGAANAGPLPLDERVTAVGSSHFFDQDRAEGFWSDLKTLPALEQAWERCENNEAFAHWNNVWLIERLRHGEFAQGESDRGLPNTLTLWQEHHAIFIYSFILVHYGVEEMQMVTKDFETVRYCHDLLRTYESWNKTYSASKLNPERDSRHGVDYTNISEPFNGWERHCYYMSMVKGFNEDECNDLPDWRTPEEVAKYDAGLVNNQIARAKSARQTEEQRATSRKVVEDYLASHGDSLSEADRDALKAAIE
ncbi:hypothetical protein TH9_06010 [Thalassospira xiamenensis]|uniref:hypothetical protein n=1 Tax=Thalassospira xiamenensis TaxID=220697 RepID=UPI000DFD23AA|nr:hypothetical protein [Thalassospira xiamenensis]RCK33959.1 hypothetical protein TH9_06010 [Thalassospira xiamenensis]